MSNNLPKFTSEQLSKAAEKAVEARRARAALKAELASGAISVTDALDDPRAGKIRVDQFLRAVPGVGDATCKKLMVEIGICESRRVGGLGVNQRADIVERLDKGSRR